MGKGRILVINYEYPPLGGGGGVASSNLAREWVNLGYKVDVVTTHFKGLKYLESDCGVRVFRIPVLGRRRLPNASLLSLLTYPFLSSLFGIILCLKNRYYFISTHFVVPSGPTGILLSKIFGITHIFSIYGGDIYDPTKKWSPHRYSLLRLSVKKLLNLSDYIVAESSDTKENAQKYYPQGKNIDIIPVGFCTPSTKKVPRSQLCLQSGVVYLVAIGRLVERKGFSYLVDAMLDLDDNVHLLIIGDGPQRDKLNSLVERKSLTHRVTLLGFVEENKKFQYLLASDLYVLSSVHEGLGIVLQEAMWAKLPIISTNCGGQTDFESEGILFVPSKSVGALSRAVKKLLQNPSKMSQMAKSNADYIKKMSIERCAKKYLALL